MSEYDAKKSQRSESRSNQKKWKKNMMEKLGLTTSVVTTDIIPHQQLNHAVHPCFCKGKNLNDKWNKFRNKKNEIDVNDN